MKFFCNLGIILLSSFFLLSNVYARTVYLYDGDKLELPDGWEYHRGNPVPSDQPGMLFSAGAKDGCGLRLDSAGLAQKVDEFTTSKEQFDDYITQLFARTSVKIVNNSNAKQTQVAKFRALEKIYEFEQNATVHKAVMLQFNSMHHLYNAGIVALSDGDFDACLEQGRKILETFKSTEQQKK